MAWVWNPIGALSLAGAVVAVSLAAVVFLARPALRMNRYVALCLLLDATATLGSSGVIYLTDEPAVAYASQALGMLATLLAFGAYLLMISHLDTPLVAPLRRPGLRAAIVLATAASIGAFFVWREFFLLGVARVSYAVWEGRIAPGALPFNLAFMAVSIFALVASISALRRARSETARRRARSFALAFGVRDALILLTFATIVAGLTGSVYLAPLPLVTYVPLVAYGVLRNQLFDIDLRLKRGVVRGTIVAAFIAVFFIVEQVAQAVVSASLGVIAGLVAAGLLLVVLRPLEALARRTADAIMPGVDGTPDYLAERKSSVYRAALEGALADGEITQRERAVLARLRESLGIADAEAAALERDVAAAKPS